MAVRKKNLIRAPVSADEVVVFGRLAQTRLLPDGRRLHLHHGPIDLIIEATGETEEVRTAYEQAMHFFAPVLEDLMEEVATLRTPVGMEPLAATGIVARRMVSAAQRHAGVFVTPMAAVAGAVADGVLVAMTAGRTLERASINNGGDIALFLAPGQSTTVGIVASITEPRIVATARIDAASPIRGVATSGQGGRSFSLGIADAVTVLASDGASADVAATLIANAVNVDSPAITRMPACDLAPDSDLLDLPVVVAVGSLTENDVEFALDRGAEAAAQMRQRGLIEAAYLSLRNRFRVVGGEALVLTPSRSTLSFAATPEPHNNQRSL